MVNETIVTITEKISPNVICEQNVMGKIGEVLTKLLTPLSKPFNSLIAKLPINENITLGIMCFLISLIFIRKVKLTSGIVIIIFGAFLFLLLKNAGFGG